MTEINTASTATYESSHAAEDTSEEALASKEAESTNEALLLYPGVQRVMDSLQKIVEESAETEELQHTELGEPILTVPIVNTWAKEVGFGNGKRGTFHNDEVYTYIKQCNEVPQEQDIDEAIATARHLTSLGAIHPASQWGVFKTDRGEYQLFVVSPKLEPWELDEKLSGTYDDRPVQPMEDLSHLTDWFKRVDPNFVPGQPIPEGSLLYHLNWTEASHHDNWGWDETGSLFPVDVEVLRPNKPSYFNSEPWKPIDSGYIEIY